MDSRQEPGVVFVLVLGHGNLVLVYVSVRRGVEACAALPFRLRGLKSLSKGVHLASVSIRKGTTFLYNRCLIALNLVQQRLQVASFRHVFHLIKPAVSLRRACLARRLAALLFSFVYAGLDARMLLHLNLHNAYAARNQNC